MISYVIRAYKVLNEAWSAPRADTNYKIYRNIYSHLKNSKKKKIGILKYLKKYPGLSEIKPINKWDYDKDLDEYYHKYTSSFFSEGKIRIKNFNTKRALIFLSGYYSKTNDIFQNKAHPQYLVSYCKKADLSLISWDSVTQGERGQNAIYKNLNSNVSTEREYSRFLSMIGSSLWNEYVSEMKYAIKMINLFYKNKAEIITVGWSMGGAFAHLVPMFTNKCKLVISSGSLARFHDLIQEGKTRLHGFFFYPLNAIYYFDLEDVIKKNNLSNSRTIFIFGENDPGCLKSSYKLLKKTYKKNQENVRFIQFKNYGHLFEPKIKAEIFKSIKKINK